MNLEKNPVELGPEAAVLGSCLASTEAMNYVFYHLPEDYMGDRRNKSLLVALKRLYKSGIEVDFVTGKNSLSEYERKTIGDKYFLDITESFPTALNIRHYVSLVKKQYIRATLEKKYEKAKQDPSDIENQKDIRKLWDELNGDEKSVVSAKDAAMRYTDTIEARKKGKFDRIVSGFKQLDNIVGGFYRGNMIVIGARTSVGKTSFALNMSVNFVKAKLKVLFVSAEMTWDELLDRIVSSESGINVSKLRRGELQQKDFSILTANLGEIAEYPFYCIEGGRMNIARIRLACEIVKPDVIVVDFIQRFTPPNPNQNRAAFFSDLANELKAIAMEKKIVIVAASQMNREIERQEKRDPQLSDLKESGGIEESADVAILLNADKQEDPMLPTRIVKFHVKKNRHGPTGQVEFTFHKRQTKFEENVLPGEEYEERPISGND